MTQLVERLFFTTGLCTCIVTIFSIAVTTQLLLYTEFLAVFVKKIVVSRNAL